MNILFILFCLLIICVIGHVTLRKKHRMLCSNKAFTVEYREKLYALTKKYFRTYNRLDRAGEIESRTYEWLTMNVNEMQFMMGYLGVVDYRPAYHTNYLVNYKIVVNTLPKFRDNSITEDDTSRVDDCLLRYLGSLNASIKTFNSKYLNPMECAKYGMRWIMSVPIELLGWFGLMTEGEVKKAVGSKLFRLVNGLVWLMGAIVGVYDLYQLIKRLVA